MNKIWIYIILCCCSLLYRCSEKEKSAEITDFSGIYIFSQAPSRDTLYIKADSTYKHKFWSSSGEEYEAIGNWSYDPKSEEILFKKFVFFNDSGPVTPAGNWFSRTRLSENNIDLMYSKENNIFYRKHKVLP